MKSGLILCGIACALVWGCSQASKAGFDHGGMQRDVPGDMHGLDIGSAIDVTVDEVQLQDKIQVFDTGKWDARTRDADTAVTDTWGAAVQDLVTDNVQDPGQASKDVGRDLGPEDVSQAEPVCTPNCQDRECGDDGCGGSCGTCNGSNMVCANHHCVHNKKHDARFIDQQVPQKLQPGQTVDVSVTMQNFGTATWTRDKMYRLGSQAPQDNTTWGTGRVELDKGEAIGPGETKKFTFQVKAPAAAGFYDFQWRMVQDGVEWFGDFTKDVKVQVGAPNVCKQARDLADKDVDASAVLQSCIDNTPAGKVLMIPPGVYRLDHGLKVQAHAIVLTTEGKSPGDPECPFGGQGCAVLKASPAFNDQFGLLQLLKDGSAVDHIVIDGNKAARWSTNAGNQCGAGRNSYGYNMRVVCNNCSVTNSVSKDALCGTGCEVTGKRSHITIRNDTIAENGVHNRQGLWSDGLTVHDAADSVFTDNEIRDNTDVDMIFGGCQRCRIQNNKVLHTKGFTSSSFAALMIHAWPAPGGGNGTSGDYTGTVTSNNTVDCGSNHGCGIGLYLGSDAWYITDVFGGSVHDNQVKNPQQGVLLDDVHNMEVYNNPVSNPMRSCKTSCGTKACGAYGMGTRTHDVDTSKDTLGTHYTKQDWDHCIPNWWK